MRKAILVVLIAALTISLALAAGANSSVKGAAIVVCGETGGAVHVVAASASAGITAPVVGTDCAPALLTLFNSGLTIKSVVQTSNGWVYTLARSSSSES